MKHYICNKEHKSESNKPILKIKIYLSIKKSKQLNSKNRSNKILKQDGRNYTWIKGAMADVLTSSLRLRPKRNI